MDIKKIEIIDYKCFKNIKINNIKSINVIIGKNNIGKSSVLDVIEQIYGSRRIEEKSKVLITKEMDNQIIRAVFKDYVSGGDIIGNHYEFGKKYIGKDITFIKQNNGGRCLPEQFELYNELPKEQIYYWAQVASGIQIESKITKRILAERNVFPEDNDNNMSVDSNGNGITRIITNFINRSEYDENLIKIDFLNRLNEIMGEDAHFTEIVTQQIETSQGTKWEIYLREEGKGRIALSNSGSGLKTILMVLAYTILIPEVEKKKLSNYIFLFEELENNLHPSLQRRLLRYLEAITKEGTILFITTHSNVTLDAFQNSDLINILHIQKDTEVRLDNITNKIQKNKLLNDLGIKASDLLQANGIIWVEGPSDRVYINQWINWNNDIDLREGKDYQCVFYGGRLLSNLTLEDENQLVNLMSVNRNSIIILDSDKKNINSPLNKTKKRIINEAEKNGILTWVTKGREIENYIPSVIIKRFYNKETSKKEFGQYENIEDYIDKLKPGEGKRFLRDKTEFARNIISITNWNDFKSIYDLNKMITNIKNEIIAWNFDKKD